MNNKAQFNKEFNNITDILSGDEGGVPFVKARTFLLSMAEQADNGDAGARQVLDIVYKFSKLLNLASNPPKAAFKQK